MHHTTLEFCTPLLMHLQPCYICGRIFIAGLVLGETMGRVRITAVPEATGFVPGVNLSAAKRRYLAHARA